MLPTASSSGFVLDVGSLESMKARARQSPQQTEAEVARQFEALFVQMMLRSMRSASFKTGLFDSDQSRMMQSLHDEQLSLQMSEQRGLGLAEMLMAQMQRTRAAHETAAALAANPSLANPAGLPVAAAPAPAAGLPAFTPAAVPFRLHGNTASNPAASPAPGMIASVLNAVRHGTVQAARQGAELGRQGTGDVPAHVERFVRRLGDAAERVAQASGLPAKLILGQAALESGWGRQEIRHANGMPSHNLFGIKATGWQGRTAEVMTTEYVNGEPQRVKQSFRAYRSYDEGLSDYARLLTENPRYRDVVTARSEVDAARKVQEAGYATDPRYAEKLIAIMQLLPD